MLSWALFYSSLFNMNKAPMLDVIDPDGLVRSQALSAADGALRITLNGAETHRTLAGKFLAGGFGSSLQHIAFSTAGIFATARRLRALGFEPLPMPGNYFDDLAARFDLPADQVARLKAGQILYDRDATGEFFQLYSRPYGKGMFFEIVERRAGYQGFGAANAPFRIAAQKRLFAPKGMPDY
jgi:4-hydroxyphenylpyruvate dioxygenase